MSALSPLLTKLATDWPPEQWCDVTVLVAVSGGADSVALVRALHQLRATGEGRLVVAHYNHGLRGADSEDDQTFVEELGRELGLQVIVGRRDGEMEGGSEGAWSEESLRELRYAFLSRTANEAGARYVATAHTANDQVETVLHNILRGTGLAGLAGIPRVRLLTAAATLVRPLLTMTRAEVLEYLSALGQSHREDSSNAAATYTRNRLRHELLPLLERDYNPQVREALLRLSQTAVVANEWLNEEVKQRLDYFVKPIKGGVAIDIQSLNNGPVFLSQVVLMTVWRQQRWSLQQMSHEKWTQLLALAAAEADCAGPQDFPGRIRAEKQGGVLRLTRPAS